MLPAVAAVVVIDENLGGSVAAFARRIADYRRHDVRVIVRGDCASSCTMVLGLKRVCAEPGADFRFHQAFVPNALDPADTSHRSEPGVVEMMRHYPPRVRAWIDAHGGLGPELITLAGDEMRSVVPACR